MPQVFVCWEIHHLLIFWSAKMQGSFLVIKYFFFLLLNLYHGMDSVHNSYIVCWIWSGYLDLFTIGIKSCLFQTWSFEFSVSSLELQKRIAFIFMCLLFKHGRMHVLYHSEHFCVFILNVTKSVLHLRRQCFALHACTKILYGLILFLSYLQSENLKS